MNRLADLPTLDHATLYRMRAAAADKSLQDLFAGYEHRASTRPPSPSMTQRLRPAVIERAILDRHAELRRQAGG